MLDQVSIGPLINEVLAGSTRAIIALLILVIIVMANEIRVVRKDYKEALTRIENQRGDFLKLINDMQEKFLEKSEEMIEKYHTAMSGQQESVVRLKDALNNVIINFQNSSNNTYHSRNRKNEQD
ncbi:MAG: hypothetical protein [Bacteriophage sp.]|nr:MAG: hypothetical protein [Bacteriophage sp.]